jgi:hypothetical protein
MGRELTDERSFFLSTLPAGRRDRFAVFAFAIGSSFG